MDNSILNILSGSEVDEVSALIDKLEQSSFDYLKLEGEGVSIVIGKNGAGEMPSAFSASAAVFPSTAVSTATPTTAATAKPITIISGPDEPETTPGKSGAAVETVVFEQEGVVIVRSPNYGLFYAQSEPGAPPYVKIGEPVKTGETVGLLETMKTFTAISSPADGVVTAIHVKNEQTLEPGTPLITIKV